VSAEEPGAAATRTGRPLAARGGEPAPDAEPTVFRQLDEAPPPIRAVLFQALEGMAASPQIGRVRAVAESALGAAPGERVLDAGCGAGEVARALAAQVAPEGQVTAIDASNAMIEYAAAKDAGAGVRYQVGDVERLPFDDDAFDAVRCERVLQHLAEPDAGLGELVRVTRPGGRVCVIDTDWLSLAGDGLPEDLVEVVTSHLLNQGTMHQATMGRTLRRRLVRAGLGGVSAEPVPLCFTDPASAAVVLPMFNPMVPPEARMVPDELRERWFEAVAQAGEREEFLAVLTMWVAVGTVAEPARAGA
jgi:2-polyprenyl-3-methyl-5-hydroxy-6-metoxy-1,4-benzoquinol methylase